MISEIKPKPPASVFERHFTAKELEALWALDQHPAGLDLHAMIRDTLAALQRLPQACSHFRSNLPPRVHTRLTPLQITLRKSLDPAEAYNMIPGRDPQNG